MASGRSARRQILSVQTTAAKVTPLHEWNALGIGLEGRSGANVSKFVQGRACHFIVIVTSTIGKFKTHMFGRWAKLNLPLLMCV